VTVSGREAGIASAAGTGGAERWYVLGAGSLGTVLAYRLAGAGIDCVLLSHRGRESRVLCLDGREEALIAQPLAGVATGSIRRLLLTTKAGRIEAALRLAGDRLAADAVVLTTANGLGFPESWHTRHGVLPVYRAVSTAAAYRDEGGRVVPAAIGETLCGPATGTAPLPTWFPDSLGRLSDWKWRSDMAAALYRKFAVNCVINPLTALRRCRNGELLATPEARRELAALCSEVEHALIVLDLWTSPDTLAGIVADVCSSTAANRSSMLQDVLAGRTTEIEFLHGELLRRAGSRGLSLPLTEALYAQLTA
jgi:2-dehydropantoate 2-reductase